MATLGNPKNTIEIIQKYQFAFQKKFGQNFLIDTHVLDKIISAAGITGDDCVLEIGPGIGPSTWRSMQEKWLQWRLTPIFCPYWTRR